MAFLLMQTPDPTTLRDALPAFERVSHIFLPINDNRNVAVAEGGSHWSLLLVSVGDRRAFHYDSLMSANQREASAVARKLGQLLGLELEFMDLDDSPQQTNGMDCGVFVCEEIEYLLKHRLLRARKEEKVSMSMGGRDVHAARVRKHMLAVIESYRKEGEKRRS